jgi:serine protease inhibitor
LNSVAAVKRNPTGGGQNIMRPCKIIRWRARLGILMCIMGFRVFADPSANPRTLAAADNGFAFDLFQQIATEQPNENIFISPFSVSTALQMLANGAAGKTKSEIQSVLKTENLPQNKLNTACKELNQSLKSQTNVILDLADGIWYQNNFRLKPEFIAADKEFFGAELAPVDFESPKSADIINDWANKETRGKINGVVSFPFPALTRVILANAIYFKGKWDEPFDKRLTKPRDFYLTDGGKKQVPMMSQHKTFSYLENGDFQAVRLPYAGDGLAMYLFLPAKNSSPQKLVAEFRGGKWTEKIMPRFSDREGTVIFPKFKLNYDILLNKTLQALGMRQAFSDDAVFSAMADEPLRISAVKQKSFVDVNEEGTEAAAVTTVAMESMAIERPLKPFEMIVDRPFLFVIADNQTQTILFMGLVSNPTP